jgi:hypothetical protein
MRIIIAYETSKGLFWSREEAEKKENRSKNHYVSHDSGWPRYDYETVREVCVLIADVEHNRGIRGIGKASTAFKLNQVEIQ